MKPTTLLAAFVCLIGTLLPAAEGKRLAFVVGVDQYENLPPEAQLQVAVSDAKRMKETLESLDPPFTVRLVADGDVRGVESAFDAFLDEAKGAECALVYFAGHGVEYHGANFLLVKDTAISDISADVERMKRRLATQAVSLQGWVDSLDATQAQVKVVILDCCRDNPLKAEDGSGTRSVVGGSHGLAQVTPPSGTLISYSADAGQRANDGLFTEVLANNLKTPGMSILKVFAKTREEVREISTAWASEDETRGLAPDSRRSRHEPAEYNKLNLAGTDFAFTRGVPVAVKAAEPDPKMSEAEIERRAKEMAEKLVAEAMTKQPAPVIPAPAPAAPPMSTETPKPTAKSDPAPAPGAFPADRGMEGSRAGEVREFGGIEMVWCPPGEFLMGSPGDEEGRGDDETQHRVTLTRGFWMAKTETTQGQWESVMGTNPSEFKGDDLPVETVSWDDAQGWMEKMNKLHRLPAGWKWELPTEAQWEYACRAGTTRSYGGSGQLDEMGWSASTSGSKTHRVGTKKANAWGLHDMHGNVAEWCSDWYSQFSGFATDPVGPASGTERIMRGGNYDPILGDWTRRSAKRFPGSPSNSGSGIGFRPVVREAVAANLTLLQQDTLSKTTDRMEGSRAGEVREFGGIEMVWCPPGEFLMGSPEDEAGRSDDETQHRVTLTRGFWMAKTETTQGQWERMMGADVKQQKAKGDSYGDVTGEGAFHPMYFVNWEDAQEYLTKMNEQNALPSGWKWDLPTEAQWEYACRAGTTTAYAGDVDGMAWYSSNSGSKTNPVGTKEANAWGLHDMHGNVWEWCRDWYGDYPGGAATDPTGTTSGSIRVFRGGCWGIDAADCRSALRVGGAPEFRNSVLGFRPAAVPTSR